MSPRRRRDLYVVLMLMLLGAFTELVAIGAVIPFLSLLADPGRVEAIPAAAGLFNLLGAHTPEQFALAAAALFAIAAVVAGAVRIHLTWKSQSFVFLLGHDIAVEVQRRILSQSYSFHVAHNTSEIVAVLEKIQILVFNVLQQMMIAATAVLISLFIVAALIYIDPVASALAGAGFAAFYLIVSAVTRGRLARNSADIGTAFSERVKIIQESLGGIRDIIVDQSQDVYVDAFRRVDRRLSNARANTAFIGSAPRFLIEAGGMVLIAALALLMADGEGGLLQALPALGALALGAQRLLPLLQQIYYGWTLIAGNRAVIGDVASLLQLPPPADEGPSAGLPFGEQIQLNSVSFFYPGREASALDNVSLTIPRGSSAAFIGKTGSGKSTLIDLLMGLLEPSQGQILVDGTPLVGSARQAWQRSVAHVPQAIFLADTTIARNIALGSTDSEIDIERVRRAGRLAQIDQFIEDLPQGYQTVVGERGVRLSGGQRQRLGIARALYKEASVLILDEATSALDDETEAAVMKSLEQLEEQLTIIIIAHRLSTVANCAQVFRLDNGRLVESGTFSEIVETPAAGSGAF